MADPQVWKDSTNTVCSNCGGKTFKARMETDRVIYCAQCGKTGTAVIKSS